MGKDFVNSVLLFLGPVNLCNLAFGVGCYRLKLKVLVDLAVNASLQVLFAAYEKTTAPGMSKYYSTFLLRVFSSSSNLLKRTLVRQGIYDRVIILDAWSRSQTKFFLILKSTR
jgi:hypothetical protein